MNRVTTSKFPQQRTAHDCCNPLHTQAEQHELHPSCHATCHMERDLRVSEAYTAKCTVVSLTHGLQTCQAPSYIEMCTDCAMIWPCTDVIDYHRGVLCLLAVV